MILGVRSGEERNGERRETGEMRLTSPMLRFTPSPFLVSRVRGEERAVGFELVMASALPNFLTWSCEKAKNTLILISWHLLARIAYHRCGSRFYPAYPWLRTAY